MSGGLPPAPHTRRYWRPQRGNPTAPAQSASLSYSSNLSRYRRRNQLSLLAGVLSLRPTWRQPSTTLRHEVRVHKPRPFLPTLPQNYCCVAEPPVASRLRQKEPPAKFALLRAYRDDRYRTAFPARDREGHVEKQHRAAQSQHKLRHAERCLPRQVLLQQRVARPRVCMGQQFRRSQGLNYCWGMGRGVFVGVKTCERETRQTAEGRF